MSLLSFNTAICTPDSKYGSEKSNTCLRLSVMDMACDDAVHLVGLHRLQRGVETEGFDIDGEALVLGDIADEIHVDYRRKLPLSSWNSNGAKVVSVAIV